MSQECKNLVDKISSILQDENQTSFQKCAEIKGFISYDFGNDLIRKYPEIARIIGKHLQIFVADNVDVIFLTKHVIDAHVIPGNLTNISANTIYQYIVENKFALLKIRDSTNEPSRVLDRMLKTLLNLHLNPTQKFIKAATKVHNGVFDYAKTCFVSDDVPVVFSCVGCSMSFARLPQDHLHESFKCLDCFIRNNSAKPLEASHAWTQIMDKLYLGEYSAILNVGTLTNLKIKAVIDLTNGTNLPRSITQLRLKKLAIKVDDSVRADISKHFKECIDFIDKNIENNRPILVYCKQGVSRSASIIIAYLMHKTKAKFSQVYAYVKSRRQKVLPNRAFMEQLKRFQ